MGGGGEVESKRWTSSLTRSRALLSPSSMADVRWPAAEVVE